MKITSDVIINALASKHCQDVFISECKTGSSHSGCVRMDAWVMKKSWASPGVTAYEIKITRSDFLNDIKWSSYLSYCNELYFICPPKLIAVTEVPENVGLMYVSSTGTRIYTKKKAVYRDVEVPEDLYRYLLMWRTIVTREHAHDKLSKREYWQNWLEQRTVDKYLGYEVSKALREAIEKEIIKAKRVNKELKERLERYDYLVDFLKRINIDPRTHYLRSDVERKLKELQALVPEDLKRNLKWTKDQLEELLETIDKKVPEPDESEESDFGGR